MTSATTRARIEGPRPDRITAPADVLGATNAKLVSDLKVLTHRLHETDRTDHKADEWSGVTSADLRVQRDAVEVEVLRRMALGWEARA